LINKLPRMTRIFLREVSIGTAGIWARTACQSSPTSPMTHKTTKLLSSLRHPPLLLPCQRYR